MDEHEWECYLDHFWLYRSPPATDSHHNNGACFTLSSGFMFSEETCVCAESISDYAECEVQNQTITRRNSSWISPASDSIMIFDRCPFDYCNVKEFYASNPDGQCDHNRSGILCGDCIQGYSLSLGSNQCLNCANKTWNMYTIVLGSALAGIGLVALLITLNLTVSVGKINGLLFYVNVVKICESVLFAKNEPKLLEYVFAWLNFDLGMATCFLKDWTRVTRSDCSSLFRSTCCFSLY